MSFRKLVGRKVSERIIRGGDLVNLFMERIKWYRVFDSEVDLKVFSVSMSNISGNILVGRKLGGMLYRFGRYFIGWSK